MIREMVARAAAITGVGAIMLGIIMLDGAFDTAVMMMVGGYVSFLFGVLLIKTVD